jgi:hypothetical protein
MRSIRLLVAGALLGGAALAAAAPTSAHDVCRYAPYNGHACIRYGDHAFFACDDQVDGHKVRAWVWEWGGERPWDGGWAPNLRNKKYRGTRKACTHMIHTSNPGGIRVFRVCTQHEGCTRWRKA